MQVISFQLLLQASHKHNYHSLANGGSPQQGAAPFLMLPVRQETPDMNTVRRPFKRETDDKTFPQNVLVLDTTFL